jgi:hypothetical protein
VRGWRDGKAELLSRLLVLSQLTILARAPVKQTGALSFRVFFLLTGNASPNAGNRLATRFRNGLATVLAVGQALALRQLTANTLDSLIDAGVDLILNCPVFGPTTGHGYLLKAMNIDLS